jgi:hypothetical protein
MLLLNSLQVIQSVTELEYSITFEKESPKSMDLAGWTHGYIEELLDTITPIQIAAANLAAHVDQIDRFGTNLVNYELKMDKVIGTTGLPSLRKVLSSSIQSDEITGGVRGVLQLLRQRFKNDFKANT